MAFVPIFPLYGQRFSQRECGRNKSSEQNKYPFSPQLNWHNLYFIPLGQYVSILRPPIAEGNASGTDLIDKDEWKQVRTRDDEVTHDSTSVESSVFTMQSN